MNQSHFFHWTSFFIAHSFLFCFQKAFCWLVHPRLDSASSLVVVQSISFYSCFSSLKIPLSFSAWLVHLSLLLPLHSISTLILSVEVSTRLSVTSFILAILVFPSSSFLFVVFSSPSLWLQFFWFWSNVISSWLTFGSIAFKRTGDKETDSRPSRGSQEEGLSSSNDAGVNEWIPFNNLFKGDREGPGTFAPFIIFLKSSSSSSWRRIKERSCRTNDSVIESWEHETQVKEKTRTRGASSYWVHKSRREKKTEKAAWFTPIIHSIYFVQNVLWSGFFFFLFISFYFQKNVIDGNLSSLQMILAEEDSYSSMHFFYSSFVWNLIWVSFPRELPLRTL